MQKVTILGHKGMLGNAVFKYLSSKSNKYEIAVVEGRWDDETLKRALINLDASVIINCIGAIPQKNPDASLYKKVNIDFPIFLEGLQKRIIHPSSDCEFSGKIEPGERYLKNDTPDAFDEYGKSKAAISKMVTKQFKNTKIIRTSIIGHEEKTHNSLLDWFLNSTDEVNGYTNHYWNGITTLEWAKLCEDMIDNWGSYPTLNQYGGNDFMSKYDLLHHIKNVYSKDLLINRFETPETVNKLLVSDKELNSIVQQLQELKIFYNK